MNVTGDDFILWLTTKTSVFPTPSKNVTIAN